MHDKLFRLIDLREDFLLFSEMSVFDPDFPEYLKMMQIGGSNNYLLQLSTGLKCAETNVPLYEGDIVQSDNSVFLIEYDPPSFVLRNLQGEELTEIDPQTVVKIGSNYEKSESIRQLLQTEEPDQIDSSSLLELIGFVLTDDAV